MPPNTVPDIVPKGALNRQPVASGFTDPVLAALRVRAFLGPVSDRTLEAILAARPSDAELQEIAGFLDTEGSAEGRPALSGRAAEICRLAADDAALAAAFMETGP